MDRREKDRQLQEAARLDEAASKRQLLFTSAARAVSRPVDNGEEGESQDVDAALDEIARSLENLMENMEAIYY